MSLKIFFVVGTFLWISLGTAAAAKSHNPACPANISTRFLSGTREARPLAYTAKDELRNNPETCCKEWSKIKSWIPLDRYGKPQKAVVARTDWYEYTSCFEFFLPHLEHVKDPLPDGYSGIYVNGKYKQTRSFEWKVPTSDNDALKKLDHDTQMLTIGGVMPLGDAVAFEKRSIFFQFKSDPEKKADDLKMAVVGGPFLAVYLLLNQKWVLNYLENDQANENNIKPLQTRAMPMAVLDLDGNALPEIIFHTKEGGGEWYGETILAFHSGHWRYVGESVFGSTE